MNIHLAFLLCSVHPLYTRTSQESLDILYEVGGVHFYRGENEGPGRSHDLPRDSLLLWFPLLQRTEGGAVPEPRLFGSADLAPGQGSTRDKRAQRSSVAPHEHPGGRWGRARWWHLVKKPCPFLSVRAPAGRPGGGAEGYKPGCWALELSPERISTLPAAADF